MSLPWPEDWTAADWRRHLRDGTPPRPEELPVPEEPPPWRPLDDREDQGRS